MDEILKSRVTMLNDSIIKDREYVAYWLQSSIRAADNPALDVAVSLANSLRLPLIMLFSIDRSIPSANRRNFTFMLEGLKDAVSGMERMGATVCIRYGKAVNNAIEISKKAAALVTDESHLKEGSYRRRKVAENTDVPVFQVDSNVIIPVRKIPGEQYAAYVIRPKLMKMLESHLKPYHATGLKVHRDIRIDSDEVSIDSKKIIKKLSIPDVPPGIYRGGELQASRMLQDFINKKLDGFSEYRNSPDRENTSNISPYLRFGNISPVTMIREVMESTKPQEDIDAFVEEAFVRRELAENFTFYNEKYSTMDCLPGWARETLKDHCNDNRESTFTLEELENSMTGDELWDACQYEMVSTGKMAGYMRMIWAKQVIQWTKTPEEALRILTYLNDKYEIDGRSPNGYAGIMWCFGKHDRAFGDRAVTGKIRYMSTSGAGRKFNVRKYVEKTGLTKRPYVYAGV